MEDPKKKPTTATWKKNVYAQLEKAGRGAQAAMARALKMSSGALSEVLSDEKHFSKWVDPIDVYFRNMGWPDPDPDRWAHPTTEQPLEDPKARRAAIVRRQIRRCREKAGFDVEGAADAAEVSEERWLQWEREDPLPDYDELVLIAKTLGYDTDDLLNDKSPGETKLGPTEKLWARRQAPVPPLVRQEILDAERAARERVIAKYSPEELSPGFISAKKAQQAQMAKAKAGSKPKPRKR